MDIRSDYLLHQKCQKDFKNHLYMVFKYLNLPNPTQIQYDIADVLQYKDSQGNLPDTIIEGFRGVAKSTITGCYASWRFDNDPENYQLLQLSMNQVEASKFLKFTRKLLDIVPYLNYLIPDDKKKNADSALQFDVAPAITRVQPSCKAAGIFGNITGNRATEIIADDIETSQNCDTIVKREQIRKAITEFSPIVRPLKGRILYLGTPHTEESIYNEEARKGFRVQIFPVRYPNEQEELKYNGNLADTLKQKLKDNPLLIGKPTDPKRFDEETILKEEAKGRSKFLMQYMLDNTLSDLERYPLKCSDLIVIDTDKDIAPEKAAYGSSPNLIIKDLNCYGFNTDKFYSNIPIENVKWQPYTFKLMSIDPSGRGKDELAITIIGVLNGQLFLLKSEGLQEGYSPENLKHIAELAAEYKVNKIIIESNFGDGMFSSLLTPVINKIYPCTLDEVSHHTQKERRIIDTLEPVMNQHRLIVGKDVIKEDSQSVEKYPAEIRREYSLFYQMTRLTKDRNCLAHDDRLDCLAIAVAACLEMLKIDTDKMILEREEEEYQKWLNQWFDDDYEVQNKSWYDL
ncbi:MAG: phage terminase large subunit [Candidatus Gastranaerophilales bacterium]|nr:phage terminase large subunit [Candidatus Gastranaerophilales bacterium]